MRDMRETRAFWLRRLHSLSGVLPIGAFLVEHLWTNSSALRGRAAYGDAVQAIQSIPLVAVLEWVLIFLPLAYHSLYGLVITLTGRGNTLRYPYPRNWLYVGQRVSGLVTLLFLVWHLWQLRVQKAFFGMADDAFYDVMAEQFSMTWHGIPLVAWLYLAGIGATVFHFANGVWGFCATWGIAVTRAAQRRVAVFASLIGAALFALGYVSVVHLATGGFPLLGSRADDLRPPPPCPAPAAAP